MKSIFRLGARVIAIDRGDRALFFKVRRITRFIWFSQWNGPAEVRVNRRQRTIIAAAFNRGFVLCPFSPSYIQRKRDERRVR